MKKLIILVIASVAVPTIAHANPILLPIGNVIFSGLYSIGISGAIANAVANSVGVIALAGSKIGESSFARVTP